MSNVVMFITYSLAEGASVPDFLEASKKVHGEFMSKQKGYVSWKLLLEGETWADMLVFESMEDAVNASEAGCADPASIAFCEFLDMESVKSHMYAIEKDYDAGS